MVTVMGRNEIKITDIIKHTHSEKDYESLKEHDSMFYMNTFAKYGVPSTYVMSTSALSAYYDATNKTGMDYKSLYEKESSDASTSLLRARDMAISGNETSEDVVNPDLNEGLIQILASDFKEGLHVVRFMPPRGTSLFAPHKFLCCSYGDKEQNGVEWLFSSDDKIKKYSEWNFLLEVMSSGCEAALPVPKIDENQRDDGGKNYPCNGDLPNGLVVLSKSQLKEFFDALYEYIKDSTKKSSPMREHVDKIDSPTFLPEYETSIFGKCVVRGEKRQSAFFFTQGENEFFFVKSKYMKDFILG